MMKFKIQAGAEVDIISEPEMRRIFADWMVEIGRGVKFRKAGGQVQLSAGTWRVDSTTKIEAGPQPGFLWSVTRVAVLGGGYVPGTDSFSIFNGDPSNLTAVSSAVSRSLGFGIGEMVIQPGDVVGMTGVGTGVNGTDINVTLLVAEVPIQLAWQLLG
jgi:hypothetical protein